MLQYVFGVVLIHKSHSSQVFIAIVPYSIQFGNWFQHVPTSLPIEHQVALIALGVRGAAPAMDQDARREWTNLASCRAVCWAGERQFSL